MFNKVVNRVGWPTLLVLGALGLWGCPPSTLPPNPPNPGTEEEARAALQAFLAAEQTQDFGKAYELLDAALRGRYTPERLQKDYQRDQDLARDKLARIRAALQAGTRMQLHDGKAELPLGPNRNVELIKEPGGWKMHSLE